MGLIGRPATVRHSLCTHRTVPVSRVFLKPFRPEVSDCQAQTELITAGSSGVAVWSLYKEHAARGCQSQKGGSSTPMARAADSLCCSF